MGQELDQFYTQEKVAKSCWRMLKRRCAKLVDWEKAEFIEPSAGAGAFLTLMPEGRREGLDLQPAGAEIAKGDFLRHWPKGNTPKVVVGNPPFGRRGKQALAFFLHAAEWAETVAFIVPCVFTRWEIHARIPAQWRLIHEAPLAAESFKLPSGQPYSVGTVFQIWTKRASRHKDLRITERPPVRHQDFGLLQYNNTPKTLHLFSMPFDFGVPCQGWQDYTRRETDPDACERHKQWMLFHAPAEPTREILESIDFEALAHRGTTTIPGFRKADVVQAYKELRA